MGATCSGFFLFSPLGIGLLRLENTYQQMAKPSLCFLFLINLHINKSGGKQISFLDILLVIFLTLRNISS